MPNEKIPYSRQWIEQDDINAVVETLKSDWLTQGPKVAEFETALAKTCNAKYAVAFSNGTAALHAACVALGIKSGDEGIVPPITFAASANCLLYVGAKPIFADVTENQLNELPLIDPQSVLKQLSPKTKLIIPVHFSGASAAMNDLYKIAKENNLKILEDACHALGASYYSEKDKSYVNVGSCSHSDACVFSFHPVKNITTGEGGAVTTNSEEIYLKLKQFRQHGIIFPNPEENKPGWYYEMQDIGFNFRLTEMQAALGISQLKKLDKFCKAREEKISFYKEAFKNQNDFTLLVPHETCKSANHLAIIRLQNPLKRDELFAYLRSKNIFCQLHYIPVYRHPYYQNNSHFKAEDFPNSESYAQSSLSIPLFPQMDETQLNFVTQSLNRFFLGED